MKNSKFDKLYKLVMEDAQSDINNFYDKLEEEFKSNLSFKEKVAFKYGQLDGTSDKALLKIINNQAEDANISIKDALEELDLIQLYNIKFGTPQENQEYYGINKYTKRINCYSFIAYDNITVCYIPYLASEHNYKPGPSSQYWSIGLELNRKFNKYIESANIELPIDVVCKDWGILNGFSGKKQHLYSLVVGQHNKMIEEHPEAHHMRSYARGNCWTQTQCTCGFAYDTDSSD